MAQIIDVKIIQDPITKLWDIAIGPDGDLVGDDSFNTTLALSIFGDQRAAPDEMTSARLRRGWIGDIIADLPGFKTGSKRWLLDQARNDENTLNIMQSLLQEKLEWMVEEKLISRVDVVTVFRTQSLMEAEVTITLLSGQTLSYLFEAWKNTGI